MCQGRFLQSEERLVDDVGDAEVGGGACEGDEPGVGAELACCGRPDSDGGSLHRVGDLSGSEISCVVTINLPGQRGHFFYFRGRVRPSP